MHRPGPEFPFGNLTSPVVVIGTIGLDIKAEQTRSIDGYVMPGRKRGVDTIGEFNDVIKKYGIQQGREFSGFTAGNVAMGVAKKGPEDQKTVFAFTTLAPVEQDDTSPVIRGNLEYESITVIPTDAPDTLNGRSLILRPYRQRRIVTFKDKRTPGIVMEQNGIRPGVAIFCNAAGDWTTSWEQGIEYAEATGAKPFIVASESQIKQLGDKHKRDIYEKVLRSSGGFSGNVDEAEMLAGIYGLSAGLGDPIINLARQLQGFGQEKTVVTLTNGPEGGVTVDGHGNVVTHYVPDEPNADQIYAELRGRTPFGQVINTLGAGDEHAATMVAGLREKGANLDGLIWTVLKAADSSTRVVGRDDAQTGQLRRPEFLADPHPAVRVDVYKAPAWI